MKVSVLTLGSLLILRRAPVPTDHFALSRREVSLSLVKDNVFLGKQSFQPSDLTPIPLGGGPLLLGFHGEVTNPFSKGATLSRASRASVARAEHFCRSSAETSHSFASSPSAASRAAFSSSQAAQASRSPRRNVDFSKEAAWSACEFKCHAKN